MTKNKGSSNRRRRKNSKDIEEDYYEEEKEKDHDFDGDGDEGIAKSPPTNTANNKNLTFTERRELQRKSAADKRRQKMKVSSELS